MILDKLIAKFKPNPHLNKTIEQIDFTVRTYNILKRQGMATVGDLIKLSWKDIAGMRRANRRMCVEISSALDGMGLGLRNE